MKSIFLFLALCMSIGVHAQKESRWSVFFQPETDLIIGEKTKSQASLYRQTNAFPPQTIRVTYNYSYEKTPKVGLGFNTGGTYSFNANDNLFFKVGIGIGVVQLRFTSGSFLKSIDTAIVATPPGNDGTIYGGDIKPDLNKMRFIRLFIPFNIEKKLKNEKFNIQLGGKLSHIVSQSNSSTSYYTIPPYETVYEHNNFLYADFFVTGTAAVGYSISSDIILSIQYERSITNLVKRLDVFSGKMHFQSIGLNFSYRL